MADGSTFDASSGGASRRRSFYRQVAILERWRVTACLQGFASFCSQTTVTYVETPCRLKNACSQHVVVLTASCERRGLVETGCPAVPAGAMRESGTFTAAAPLHRRSVRSTETRVGMEQQIASHADVCPY